MCNLLEVRCENVVLLDRREAGISSFGIYKYDMNHIEINASATSELSQIYSCA